METIILLLGMCAAAYVICRIILLLIEISLYACLLFIILVVMTGDCGAQHIRKHIQHTPSDTSGEVSL